MAKRQRATAVPRAVQVQLARLFGSNSVEARATARTNAQWRRTLQRVLRELSRFVESSVDTDELHSLMLDSGFVAAGEALQAEDFWPGYVEGITRILLVLLGDYPDHRQRRGGAKAKDHYELTRFRTHHYNQGVEQRFRTLIFAGNVGLPRLTVIPRQAQQRSVISRSDRALG
jgi:hypothetical protein